MAQDAGEKAAAFTRSIAPFPVRGAGEQPYRFPFLGGLSVPRPQLADIDADSDADLFLQEETGRLMFFENTGTPEKAAFAWRTDDYRDLAVGEWYRFTDLDGDGDFDLLAERPYSYVRYYRNTGTPEEAAFALAADTLKSASGKPIFSDRQNIPNVNDIDCDGLPDLFLGRLDGTITRYEQAPEASADAPADAPRFRLVTDRFEGIEIVAQISQPGGTPAPPPPGFPGGPSTGGPSASNPSAGSFGPSLHGANTMAFADFDADGDPDLLWGDYFEPGLLLIENTGSCERPDLRTEPRPFPPADPLVTSGYNAPTAGDLDGDGDLDLLVGVIGGAFNPSRTAQDNLYFYEHTEDGYALRTRRFLDGLDVGDESFPALGDLDGDGDPDLLLGNKISADGDDTARLLRYENEGSAAQPVYRLADTLDAPASYNFAPTLGDLTGDGHPDMLLGTWNDGVAFYENDGRGGLALADSQLVQLSRGSHTAPALGDLDQDGDLDLLVGETSGTLNFFRNAGTPQAPRFERVADTSLDIDVGRRSAPALADLDGDGLLDLVVGTEADGLAAFRNAGTPQQPDFARDTTLALPETPPLAVPAFVDVNGDGALDLVTGTGRGGLLFFKRRP